MTETNYGATLTKGGASVGKCQVTDWPEIATAKAPSTHHGSGGYAESIPNGLITLGDITLTLLLEDGVLDGIHDDIVAKSIEEIIIVDGIDTFTFDGFYLSAKKQPADANAPDTNKATVIIACTGPIVITTTP